MRVLNNCRYHRNPFEQQFSFSSSEGRIRIFYAVVRILDLWLGFSWTKSEFWLGKPGISLQTQTSKFNMAAAVIAAGVTCSSDGLCSTPSIVSLGLSRMLLLSKFCDLTVIGPHKKKIWGTSALAFLSQGCLSWTWSGSEDRSSTQLQTCFSNSQWETEAGKQTID